MRLAAIVLVLGLAGSAAAQDDAQRAMQLFEESRTHYDAGRFDQAAELLQEAYRLQPEPTLLYNMGRAFEGADRVAEAIDAYERYLRDAGEVRDRGAIEARLRTLRERQAREAARGQGEEQPAPAPSGGGVDPAGWIVMGVGIVGVGVGVILGVLAQDAHDSAVAEPIHADAYAMQQSAYDLATGANAAFIAGGAIALAGVIWGIVSIATSGGSSERASRPFTITF